MEISTERYKEIRKTAKSCFDFFRTRNPFEILIQLGVDCSLIALEGDLGGFTNIYKYSDEDNQYAHQVYINTKYDAYSQKIIAAHELGHVLLHRTDSLNMFEENEPTQIKEYEANIFALELMPQLQPQNKDYKYFSKNQLQQYINSKLFFLCSSYQIKQNVAFELE